MLILCEKASVAQSFAEALDAQKKEGYYSTPDNHILITYCVGHLYQLEEPDYYLAEGTDKSNINYLPIIPEKFKYTKIPRAIKQTKIINELLKAHQNEEIIVATDADREGEVIARIVLKESFAKIDYSRCKRFWTSENLTPSVIREAMKQMLPLSEYNNLAASGFARQHADWICGMNLSRYVSFGNSVTFSVGRVQTALLAAIAKRNKDIESFVPQKYYELEIELTDKDGNKAFAYLLNPTTKKTGFDNKNLLESAKEEIIHSKFKIESQQVEKKIGTPHLLSFTQLAKIAADKYDYTTQKTLEIAQKLYEVYKCLSYPRTNGTVMGENNVDVFQKAFDKVSGQSKYKSLCDLTLINASNKKVFDSKKIQKENHHALIPLEVLPDKASEEEKNIYNIILKVFLQSIMKDFIYEELQMIIQSDKYTLKSIVKKISQMGWKESEPDEDLRSFSNGFDPDSARISGSKILEKWTQPKKQFTESSLLAFMENPTGESADEKLVGLGTEATRGAIIEKLFTMGYCEKKKKNFFVTRKGFYLLNTLMQDEDLKQIANIAQTTKWEKMLAENPKEFELQIQEYVKHCIKPKDSILKFEKDNFGTCPVCGKGKILRGKYSYFCTEKKNGCRFNINYHICEATILPSDLQMMISGKQTKLMHMKGKNGKPFEAHLKMIVLNGEAKIEFSFEEKKKAAAGKK